MLSEDYCEFNMNVGNVCIFELICFICFNQGINFDQYFIVSVGDEVKVGQVIVDGLVFECGWLVLGQNIIIVIMFFDGFNFEDVICINEDFVCQDFYILVYIEKDEIEVCDIKLGLEKIICDILGLFEVVLCDFDEDGIVCVGVEVKFGDILVGKIFFKGEFEFIFEEWLLCLIFGEKVCEVKDILLCVQLGQGGIVVKIVCFCRGDEGVDFKFGVCEMVCVYVVQKCQFQVGDKVVNCYGNKGVVFKIVCFEDMFYFEDGIFVDIVFNLLGVFLCMNFGQIFEIYFGEVVCLIGQKFEILVFDLVIEVIIKEMFEVVVVECFQVRKDDGFEFDKCEQEVFDCVGKFGVIDVFGDDYEKGQMQFVCIGKSILYDGCIGELISGFVVVGIMYVMKFYYMVEDKLYVCFIGFYLFIIQQLFGGKVQFGGQCFGEMEVWVFEVYGVVYVFQEMFIIKFDDIDGCDVVYQSIVKGEEVLGSIIFEFFKVLVKEFYLFGLDVEVFDYGDKVVDIFEGMMFKC